MQFSSVTMISCLDMPEKMAAELMPRFCRCITWSFIRDISGVMTIQTPSWAKAGTWKVMDLPPPVGIRPKVSLPESMLSMMDSCIPLKDV